MAKLVTQRQVEQINPDQLGGEWSPGPGERWNQSGLLPLGRAILVYPYEPEINKTVLVIPETVRARTAMVETRAIIVAIGPVAWDDEPQPRAAVGDKVIIARMAGCMMVGPKDNKVYRMVNDRDVFTKLEE